MYPHDLIGHVVLVYLNSTELNSTERHPHSLQCKNIICKKVTSIQAEFPTGYRSTKKNIWFRYRRASIQRIRCVVVCSQIIIRTHVSNAKDNTKH